MKRAGEWLNDFELHTTKSWREVQIHLDAASTGEAVYVPTSRRVKILPHPASADVRDRVWCVSQSGTCQLFLRFRKLVRRCRCLTLKDGRTQFTLGRSQRRKFGFDRVPFVAETELLPVE